MSSKWWLFRCHMFPKELFVGGAGSVYLFLMKTAVTSMADISSRSLSHTEENDKQQTASFCQLLSLRHPHLHTSMKATLSARRATKPNQNTTGLSRGFVCTKTFHFIVSPFNVVQYKSPPMNTMRVKLTMFSHSGVSAFFSGIPWGSY